MTTTIVDVVDVVTVRHRDMATAFAMGMVMVLVGGVPTGFALVEMSAVGLVKVPVMDVVHVVTMWDRNVSTAFTMDVLVVSVFGVGNGHLASGFPRSRRSPARHLPDETDTSHLQRHVQ
ncbi:hypothetical protein M2432_000185 [Mycobacterium sp. OTB74]|nr:hypothetical protein [Mycobacterium sp. OTB74]